MFSFAEQPKQPQQQQQPPKQPNQSVMKRRTSSKLAPFLDSHRQGSVASQHWELELRIWDIQSTVGQSLVLLTRKMYKNNIQSYT